MNRLKEKYNEIKKDLMKDLQIKNSMQLPKIQKVVVNAGIGDFRDDKGALETFTTELADITGQKPVERKARLSEAGFKIRKGDVVGLSVTLRGDNMWVFLDKLIGISLPRVKDFRGLNEKAFDKAGNYSIGIKEHAIFPEVNPNTTKGIRHLQVTVVTKAGNAKESEILLRELGFPLRKKDNG